MIIAINGLRINDKDLSSRLKDFKPKQSVTFTYLRRDKLKTATVKLAMKPKSQLKIIPVAKVSAKQQAFFKAWTGIDFPKKKS